MGGTNCNNDVDVGYLLDSGFQCPKLQYPLRNPLIIAKFATESVHAKENLLLPLLRQHVDIETGTNMSSGCLFVDSVIYDHFHAALLAVLGQLASHPQMFAMIFINSWSASGPSYLLPQYQRCIHKKIQKISLNNFFRKCSRRQIEEVVVPN